MSLLLRLIFWSKILSSIYNIILSHTSSNVNSWHWFSTWKLEYSIQISLFCWPMNMAMSPPLTISCFVLSNDCFHQEILFDVILPVIYVTYWNTLWRIWDTFVIIHDIYTLFGIGDGVTLWFRTLFHQLMVQLIEVTLPEEYNIYVANTPLYPNHNHNNNYYQLQNFNFHTSKFSLNLKSAHKHHIVQHNSYL